MCADINECASNPCVNGGTCVDGINQYTCMCRSGTYGTNCENSKHLLVTKMSYWALHCSFGRYRNVINILLIFFIFLYFIFYLFCSKFYIFLFFQRNVIKMMNRYVPLQLQEKASLNSKLTLYRILCLIISIQCVAESNVHL